jgi:hypothetical protein
MPSSSEKQRRFFQAVKTAKHNPNYGDAKIQKVASSMGDKDIDAFASSVAELKTKKAVLAVLKELREPLHIDEETETNPVAKKFNVKDKFDNYIKKFLGQPFQPKELEAFDNFEGAKPVQIQRTEVKFETTDEFNYSTTTVLKKLKEGSQFVFTAFTKHSKAAPEGEEQQPVGGHDKHKDTGGDDLDLPDLDSLKEQEMTPELDDIIVSKSVSFQDEIKGGATLSEFLKKLDL